MHVSNNCAPNWITGKAEENKRADDGTYGVANRKYD